MRGVPRLAALYLLANTLSFVGLGLSLQYPLIYLSKVRGFDLAVASVLVAASAGVGLIGSPLAGWLVDKFGPRTTLMITTVGWAIGAALFGWVDSLLGAGLVLAVISLSSTMRFTAFGALIGTLVPIGQRSRIFSLNYAGLNLGIGLGGMAAGFLVDITRPWTFVVLYSVQALFVLSLLPFLVATPTLDATFQKGLEVSTARAAGHTSMIGALRDRRFAMLCLVTFLFWFNVMQLNNIVPLYANQLGLSPRVMGLGLGLNTFAIVLLQLPVFGLLRGRRRSIAVVLMFGLLLVAFSLLLFSGVQSTVSMAGVMVIGTLGLGGVAETVMSPTLPPLVMDLAPQGWIGRYNGILSMTTAICAIVVPLSAGLFVNAGTAPMLIVGMLGTLALAAVCAVLLGRSWARGWILWRGVSGYPVSFCNKLLHTNLRWTT